MYGSETGSEFGKGLSYCLGLFLAHAERYKQSVKSYEAIAPSLKTKYPGKYDDYNPEQEAAEIWFNAASDHFYDMIIPEDNSYLGHDTINLLKELKEKSLHWGHDFPKDSTKATKADVQWAIKTAKLILFELDKGLGFNPIKAEFE